MQADVVIPGALIVIGVMTEVIKAYGGMSIAKQVKSGAIANIGEEVADPERAARVAEGVRQLDDFWRKSLDGTQTDEAGTRIRKKIGCGISTWVRYSTC